MFGTKVSLGIRREYTASVIRALTGKGGSKLMRFYCVQQNTGRKVQLFQGVGILTLTGSNITELHIVIRIEGGMSTRRKGFNNCPARWMKEDKVNQLTRSQENPERPA